MPWRPHLSHTDGYTAELCGEEYAFAASQAGAVAVLDDVQKNAWNNRDGHTMESASQKKQCTGGSQSRTGLLSGIDLAVQEIGARVAMQTAAVFPGAATRDTRRNGKQLQRVRGASWADV